MFIEPLIFVVSLTFKWFMAALKLLIKFAVICFKYGFGWLFLGYIIEYLGYGGQKGSEYVVLMIIAWGGTLVHFGIKLFLKLRKKNATEPVNSEQETI